MLIKQGVGITVTLDVLKYYTSSQRSIYRSSITVTLDVLKSVYFALVASLRFKYNSNIRCIEIRLYEKDARGGTSITVTLDVLK